MSQTAATDREVVLLINTRSLKGLEWYGAAKQKLTDAGITLAHAEGFANASDLIRCAHDWASPDRVLAIGGGDGTLSAVANVIVERGGTLGVLPLGTGNAFARDLGIPTDLDKAIEIISAGVTSKVDLGICDGRYFVNVVTIGLTTTIANTLTVRMKRRFGRFVYGIALVRALRNQAPFAVMIETENGETSLEAVELVIGNGYYHGGPLPLSPLASITSGSLRLYAVEAGNALDLIKYAMLLPTGLQGLLRTVHSESTIGGKVKTTPIQSVVVDGEVSHRTPITFASAPLALSVVVPISFRG